VPTPIGHSLAGYAAARLTRVRVSRDDRVLFLYAGLLGILPDLLGLVLSIVAQVPVHGFSHSLVALVLVSTLTAAGATRSGFRFWPILLLVSAAYGSHLFADLLRPEPTAGAGEQLLWPLPVGYGLVHNILPHVPDRAGAGGTLAWLRMVGELGVREILVLGPVAFAAHFIPPRISARRSPGR
jgi:membrane-bound metal-dependent hydrolase YbcI (DUF457 family)